MVKNSSYNVLDTVKSLILKKFYFLESDFNYSHTIRKNQESVFLEGLDVEYNNALSSRTLNVSYTKGEVYGQIKFTFSISIVKNPYTGVNDFFSLSNYLQFLKEDFNTSINDEFDEKEAEVIIDRLIIQLKKYALKIIDGSEWLKEYYPRKD